MQSTWWQWEGIPFTEVPPCRREDKGHRPQGFVRPRTLAECREMGWPGAAAHSCTWPRAALGQARPDSTLCSGPTQGCVWAPRPRGQAGSGAGPAAHPAFCLMLVKKTLVAQAPVALCLWSTGQEGGISEAAWVSVHQTGSQLAGGSRNWVNRLQLT